WPAGDGPGDAGVPGESRGRTGAHPLRRRIRLLTCPACDVPASDWRQDSVTPWLTDAEILSDRHQRLSGRHPVGVQETTEMVDLMRNESGEPVPESGDAPHAVEAFVLHLDDQRARH